MSPLIATQKFSKSRRPKRPDRQTPSCCNKNSENFKLYFLFLLKTFLSFENYLGTDLVATLSGLNVNNFSHFRFSISFPFTRTNLKSIFYLVCHSSQSGKRIKKCFKSFSQLTRGWARLPPLSHPFFLS